MNRMLRAAVITGAESSVRIHIEQGENVNARDGRGLTALMIAATRDDVEICRLLLSAGADKHVLDPQGRTALQIARANSAKRVTSLLSDIASQREARGRDLDLAAAHANAQVRTNAAEQILADAVVDEFSLGDWEADDPSPPPAHDDAVAQIGVNFETTLSSHSATDRSTDWLDITADLPESAAPITGMEDWERHDDLRRMLLRAIREGSVPLQQVEDLTRRDDQTIDGDAAALLGKVLNDMGVDADEREEFTSVLDDFKVEVAESATADEDQLVGEALAHLDALASNRNDPLRIFSREANRFPLLTAAEEIAIARRMERGKSMIVEAVSALPSALVLMIKHANYIRDGASVASVVERIATLDTSDEVPDDEEAEALSALSIEKSQAQAAKLEALRSEYLTRMDKVVGFTRELKAILSTGGFEGPLYVLIQRSLAEALRPVIFKAVVLEGLCKQAHIGSAAEDANIPRASLGRIQCSVDEGEAIWRAARKEMTQSNLRLVVSISKRFMRSGIPLEDLIQEGNVGLLKAVDKFDWRRGFKFATVATWWIRQQVSRSVGDDSRLIRVPVHAHEKIQLMRRESEEFMLKHGVEPSSEYLAGKFDLSEKRVNELLAIDQPPLCIDDLDPNGETPATWYMDADVDPEDGAAHAQLSRGLEQVLGAVNKKDAMVVRMRFGVGVHRETTLEEVGKRFDITRERVRQIEHKSLTVLKSRATKVGLRGWFGDNAERDRKLVTPHAPQTALTRSPLPVSDPASDDGEAAFLRAMESRADSVIAVLAKAERLGIPVNLEQGNKGSIWVELDEAKNGDERNLVAELLLLGFKYWPREGFWK